MSKGRKEFINPYLFLLARRLLEYDFVETANGTTDLELASYIYNRYKSKKYADTRFTDPTSKKDPSASSKANSIYQKLLKPKNYRFTINKLDELVREIKVLYSFDSWSSFCAEFGYTEEAQAANLSFANEIVSETDKQIYLAHINIFILRKHLERISCDNDFKSIIAFSNNSVVKVASKREGIKIAVLEERMSGLNTSFAIQLAKSRYSEDIFSVYCCIDHFKLMRGYIIFIPLKESTFYDLKKGITFFYFLSAENMFDFSGNEKLKYVYVHIRCEALGKSALAHALKGLKDRFVYAFKTPIVFCSSFGPEVESEFPSRLGFTEEVDKFSCGITFRESLPLGYPPPFFSKTS